MGWLFRPQYFGPDRRSDGFQVRFVERRREQDKGSRAGLQSALKEVCASGLRWVDHFNYFGPDRRGDVFSFFFLERRKVKGDGPPPPLHAALRQIRMRVLDAEDAAARDSLRQRLIATAILADAQQRTDIGDLLMKLARVLEQQPGAFADPRQVLHSELIRAEALLA